MKHIALKDIACFGRSDAKMSYIIEMERVADESIEIICIDVDEADALDTYLKFVADDNAYAALLPWKTLTLRNVKITYYGEPKNAVDAFSRPEVSWKLMREAATRILSAVRLGPSYPPAIEVKGLGYLSSTGAWLLKFRPNDMVLTKLLQVEADAKIPGNVEKVQDKLEKIAASGLIGDGVLSIATDDKFHCELGLITKSDMAFITNAIRRTK